MKSLNSIKKLVAMFALGILLIPANNVIGQTNFVPNHSFESGSVPWNIWIASASDAKITGQTENWATPTYTFGVANSQARDGSNVAEIFAVHKPTWVTVYVDVPGLTRGADYKVTVPIFPNLHNGVDMSGNTQWAQGGLGWHRIKVEEPGSSPVEDTGWFNLQPGTWTEKSFNFNADQSTMRVAIELRGGFGLDNLGWYLDNIQVIQLTPAATNTPVPSAATNTPVPAPTSSVPTAMSPASLTQQAQFIQATIQAGQAAYNATQTAQAPAPTAAPQVVAAPTENAYQQLLNRTAPTDFPIPAPDSDGKVRYIVQPGDSLVHITTVACGETLDCLERLKAMNNLTTNVIWVGQELVIGPFEGQQTQAAAPEPTATPEPEAEAAAEEEAAAEPEAEADAEVDVAATEQAAAQAAEEQAAADAAATEAAALAAADEVAVDPNAPAADGEAAPEGTGSICVVMYDDSNANGTFDVEELAVLNGLFSLVNVTTNNVVSEYTTDGSAEPFCFEGLVSESYRVVSVAPSGYSATTRQEWDLTLAAGSSADLQFGAQLVDSAAAADAAGEDAGGERNIVTALLGAFGVIFLLLAAGVAGFLILANRRNAAEVEEE